MELTHDCVVNTRIEHSDHQRYNFFLETHHRLNVVIVFWQLCRAGVPSICVRALTSHLSIAGGCEIGKARNQLRKFRDKALSLVYFDLKLFFNQI